MSNPWRCLETLAAGYQLNTSLAAVPAKWRELVNGHYDGMLKAFLRTTGESAHSYPCPQECGCAGKIELLLDPRAVGVDRLHPQLEVLRYLSGLQSLAEPVEDGQFPVAQML